MTTKWSEIKKAKGVVGYAALITIDWEHQDVMWSIFTESPDCPDPLLAAKRLAASVEPDWPNHDQKLIANERAGDIQADRLLGPLRPGWRSR